MKEAKLILVPKSVKNTGDDIKYRPISIINVFAKILEAMIERRLREQIKAGGRLHASQYGFRRDRSTIEAMDEVVGSHPKRGNSLARSYNTNHSLHWRLDVKNAFNVARWSVIVEELEKRWRIDRHLIELVRNYLGDRVLIVGAARRCMVLLCVVPQGSILGSLL